MPCDLLAERHILSLAVVGSDQSEPGSYISVRPNEPLHRDQDGSTASPAFQVEVAYSYSLVLG